MAVGFFVPEDEERFESSYQSNISMVTNSATQTPLQSPVNREFLVQVFCEALTRISIAGSPNMLPSPPPSPSCSNPNTSGDVFFPRNGSNSSSVPTTPSTIRMHDDYRSEQWSPRSSISVPRRRYRLSSSSEDDEEAIPIHDDFEAYMQFRDGLQEFRGQIPPRKKKETNETKTRSRKSRDTKIWPTVVTAVVIAVGCGYLVSR